MNKSKETEITSWDCVAFPCADSCCRHGVDVFQHERDILISLGLANAADFLQPQNDEEGTLLYRTKIGQRGCVFLSDDRGCRLHASGHKPSVCCEWPRNYEEARNAAGDDYLPCFPQRYNQEISQ